MNINVAIRHEGMAEGTATWVIYFDTHSERFLLSDQEGNFYWKDMNECKLAKAHTPDQPTMFLPVQAQQQSGLAIAEPNRTMRRNGY